MKWGGYTRKGAEMLARIFGVKGFLYLLSFMALGLLLGANVKWHG